MVQEAELVECGTCGVMDTEDNVHWEYTCCPQPYCADCGIPAS